MNMQQRERWAAIRQMGKARFVLRAGFTLGLIQAVISLFYFVSGASAGGDLAHIALILIGTTVFVFTGGCCLGWAMWHIGDWQFARAGRASS